MASWNVQMKMVDIHQLAAVVKNSAEKILIVDSRSFLEFNTCHILNAVNVCCSKIVKRRLQQDKISVKEFLNNTCHIIAEDSYDIIVYDQSSPDVSSVSADSFLYVLLKKLEKVFNSVTLLKGGFLEFKAVYPALCEDKTRKCAPLISISQPCLPISNLGPTRILPFLYLGSQHDALNKEILQAHSITYELNVSTACPKPDFIQDGHFMRISVNDNYSEKLLPHFPKAFQFVDKVREANGSVLIHCLAGISRSPTIAIAFIMKHLHMTSDDAYRFVKSKRASISPNFNFLGQLLEYERQLRIEKVLDGSLDESTPVLNKRCKRKCLTDMRGTQSLKLNLEKVSDSFSFNSSDSPNISVSPGEQSPTTALAKLNFNSPDSDCVMDCTNQSYREREKAFGKHLFEVESKMSGYQAAAINCESEDAGKLNSSKMTRGVDAGKKEYFESMEGIPISSLSDISFTPCQTSACNTPSTSHEPSPERFEELAQCEIMKEDLNETSMLFDSVNSMYKYKTKLDKELGDTIGHWDELTKEFDAQYEIVKRNRNTHEQSPRPTFIGVPSMSSQPLDSEEDEGVELRNPSGLQEKRSRLVHTLSDCSPSKENFKFSTADDIPDAEKLFAFWKNFEPTHSFESSHDSGIVTSPTWQDTNVKLLYNHSDAESPDDYKWKENEREASKVNSEINKNVTSTKEELCPMNYCPQLCTDEVKRTILKSLTQKLSTEKSDSPRKEDGLYRAQSCPGFVGWIQCTPPWEDCETAAALLSAGLEGPRLRRLKISSMSKSEKFRNRYSCGSLDYTDYERFNFDSCPDFSHHNGGCQKESKSSNNPERSSLSPARQSYNRNIIQVS